MRTANGPIRIVANGRVAGFGNVLAAAMIVVGALPMRAHCADERISRGRLSVGLSYPGIGIRCFVFDGWALEPRCQVESGALAAGLRACAYLAPVTGVFPYAGVEVDYARSKVGAVSGSGYAGEVFLGGEYFVMKKVSVQFDFGPAYVHLADGSWSVGGIEYVINFGLNYWFEPGKKAAAHPEPAVAVEVPRMEPVAVAPPKKEMGSKPSLAVLDLEALNVSRGDAVVAADLLRAELVLAGSFTVIEKAGMERILAEQAFQQTGCTSEECAVKVGKLLNARYMLVGNFAKFMDDFMVNVRVVDVETGQVLYADKAVGNTREILTDEIRKLSDRIARNMR